MEFEKVVLLARRSAAERNKIARSFEEERNKINYVPTFKVTKLCKALTFRIMIKSSELGAH